MTENIQAVRRCGKAVSKWQWTSLWPHDGARTNCQRSESAGRRSVSGGGHGHTAPTKVLNVRGCRETASKCQRSQLHDKIVDGQSAGKTVREQQLSWPYDEVHA